MSVPFRIVEAKFSKERSGLLKIDLSYLVPGPLQPGDNEPWDVLDTFEGEAPMQLPLTDRDAVKQGDGDWILVLTYEGITGDYGRFSEVEWDMAKIEDPIESHPKFIKQNIIQLGGKFHPDDPDKFDGWKPTAEPAPRMTPNVQRLVRNPLYGMTHYINNAPQLRVTFLAKKWPDLDVLRNIGKIDSPVAPGQNFEKPEAPDGKSWLKTSVIARLRGNVWQVSVTWELGRWSEYFYLASAV